MIEKFRPEHIEAVLSIWLEANINGHPFIPEEKWLALMEDVKKGISDSEVYLYFEKGEIAGFIGIIREYIAGLFVKPAFHSRGIGRRLLQYMQEQKRELTLDVFVQNERAVSFYLNNGFSVVSEKPNLVFDNLPEYRMKWQNG